MKTRILNLLGIVNKAGAIISGEDSVIKGLQKGSIKMVFVASDASANTIDDFSRKCFYYHVEVVNSFTADELTKAIGRCRKIVGITDVGFCNAIKKLMEESK